jgi:hypothetical protein
MEKGGEEWREVGESEEKGGVKGRAGRKEVGGEGEKK